MSGIEEAAAAQSIFGPILGWLRRRFGRSELRLDIRRGMPFEVTHPAGSTGKAVRGLRVQVRNVSSQSLHCIAKLEEMTRSDGKPFVNAFLPIGLRTQHQKRELRLGGLFNLRAGERKLIEVAYLDETSPESEIELQYETDKYPATVPRASYNLTIKVYGSSKPADSRYRLYVDGRGILRMVRR